jgi:2-polyprenyl-3-methyl-5-hydroxy-6-metoxy-1,4-benzoquinol methylase
VHTLAGQNLIAGGYMILLVPDLTRGRGTGHLRRCIRLMAELPESRLLVSESGSDRLRGRDELDELLSGCDSARIAGSSTDGTWTSVVLDKMSASVEEVTGYANGSMTIGLDLGGAGRAYCSYLIDTLPRIAGTANVADVSYLQIPENSPPTADDSGGVLVSFGGEDPARLTEPTVRALIDAAALPPEAITVVTPSLRRLGPLPAGLHVIPAQPSLTALYSDSAWVVTAFGLTAYEAAAAGCRVVTVAPTPYHDRLAAIAGFVRAGVSRPSPRRIANAFARPDAVMETVVRARPAHRASLSKLISSLVVPERLGSPVSDRAHGPAVWRGPEKSYFRCPDTGIVYLQRFTVDEETYSSAYFAEEYQAHYGRTYLEDFDNIKAMGVRRVRAIRNLAPKARTLLDVGCAFGPFMAAAHDARLEPYGVDVSADGVRYVQETLRLPAARASVVELDPNAAFGVGTFDVVTLWYVVEHFADLDRVIRLMAGWVRPGGVLAFATPSGAGVSARRNTHEFYSGSPRDHYTIWTPASAKSVLGRFGFRVRRVRSTGHHPERYPAVRRGIVPSAVALMHSRVVRRGDTFEVYATKET